MKETQYKAGMTYLAELKLMLVEDAGLWSQQRERMSVHLDKSAVVFSCTLPLLGLSFIPSGIVR